MSSWEDKEANLQLAVNLFRGKGAVPNHITMSPSFYNELCAAHGNEVVKYMGCHVWISDSFPDPTTVLITSEKPDIVGPKEI
jgi:hypothetical protein